MRELFTLLTVGLVIMGVLLSMCLFMNFIKGKKFLYTIDRSKKVKVVKDIIYKQVGNKSLLMDVYTPENLSAEEKLPVVIFVHGEGPELFIGNAKDWGVYSSYGELLASKGFVAVTFNHRYAGGNYKKIKEVSTDVTCAVDYIRNNAAEWQVDTENICVWSFSLGGIYSSLFLKDEDKKVKCLVSYYGLLDLKAKAPKIGEIYKAFSPENYLAHNNNPRILVVKAAHDKIKGVNQSIDHFIKAAEQYNVEYEYIIHNTGGHSFDIFDDNDETRKVIEKTLSYIEKNCK